MALTKEFTPRHIRDLYVLFTDLYGEEANIQWREADQYIEKTFDLEMAEQARQNAKIIFHVISSTHLHESNVWPLRRNTVQNHLMPQNQAHPLNIPLIVMGPNINPVAMNAEEIKAQEKRSALKLIFFLFLGLIGGGLYASWYLLNQIIENFERLSYHEGSTKASLNLASLLLGSSLGVVLCETVLVKFLLGLCLTAGMANPIGLMIAANILCALIMGALVGLAFKPLYNFIETKSHGNEALSASDPMRYRLRPEEIENLSKLGFEPIAVQCAILALKEVIDIELKQSSSLFFQRNQNLQDALATLRNLRQGKLPYHLVSVGPLRFDCSKMENDGLNYLDEAAPENLLDLAIAVVEYDDAAPPIAAAYVADEAIEIRPSAPPAYMMNF